MSSGAGRAEDAGGAQSDKWKHGDDAGTRREGSIGTGRDQGDGDVVDWGLLESSFMITSRGALGNDYS